MKITFIIPSLSIGGAQMMLLKLVPRLNRSVFRAEVISMINEIPLADHLRSCGVPVHVLGMQSGSPDPRKLLCLVSKLRQSRPDLVQTWMYHADLLGGLAAKLSGFPVLWNIRHGGPTTHGKRLTTWTARLCAKLSYWVPQAIICCAESAVQAHAEIGYDTSRMHVIPNGFDLERFHPNPLARKEVRQELRIPTAAPLIGLIARYHPVKDHSNFITAAAALLQRGTNGFFLLAGEGVSWENYELAKMIDSQADRNHFRLLGARADIARLTASLDVAVSSSMGEAFSNAIGEAMACGVPCAATDVGDSAYIIGETGKIVAPGDSYALSAAIFELINLDHDVRKELGRLSRLRIEKNFSLEVVVMKYESIYNHVATKKK